MVFWTDGILRACKHSSLWFNAIKNLLCVCSPDFVLYLWLNIQQIRSWKIWLSFSLYKKCILVRKVYNKIKQNWNQIMMQHCYIFYNIYHSLEYTFIIIYRNMAIPSHIFNLSGIIQNEKKRKWNSLIIKSIEKHKQNFLFQSIIHCYVENCFFS